MLGKEDIAVVEKYAYYDTERSEVCASGFVMRLLGILNPLQKKVFEEEYGEKIPLQKVVDYTQKNWLRKKDQRWALENYENFDDDTKEGLEKLLDKMGVRQAQVLSSAPVEYMLFLGTSTANLVKRIIFLFEQVTAGALNVKNIVIMGNDEPYGKFMDTLKNALSTCGEKYFPCDLKDKLPENPTMHETMVFLFENLNWPEGKKPEFIELSQSWPCNTGHEASKFVEYLKNPSCYAAQKGTPSFFVPSSQSTGSVVLLSHQPFNDRQGLTFEAVLKRENCSNSVQVIGPGVDTYPALNKLPASSMSNAQICDNLARTLYEINKNIQALLEPEKHDVEQQAPALANMQAV